MKFVLKLEPQTGSVGTEPIELAFIDCKTIPSGYFGEDEDTL